MKYIISLWVYSWNMWFKCISRSPLNNSTYKILWIDTNDQVPELLLNKYEITITGGTRGYIFRSSYVGVFETKAEDSTLQNTWASAWKHIQVLLLLSLSIQKDQKYGTSWMDIEKTDNLALIPRSITMVMHYLALNILKSSQAIWSVNVYV